jgi:tetratricopeptide (TPR) repeat protein
MSKRIEFVRLYAVLFSLVVLAACQPDSGLSEDDTGLYTFEEGETGYPRLYSRAADLLAGEEYSQAEKVYRELVDKEPDNPNAFIGLGASLQMQDRYDAAAAVYEQALEIDPTSVEAYIGLGSANVGMGEYEAAVAAYADALALDEENPNAHWGMALSLEILGRNEAALDHLMQVVELLPGSNLAQEAEKRIDQIRSGTP